MYLGNLPLIFSPWVDSLTMDYGTMNHTLAELKITHKLVFSEAEDDKVVILFIVFLIKLFYLPQ